MKLCVKQTINDVIVVIATVALALSSSADAGCVESRLCCSGKDSLCRATGPRLSNRASRSCFCDDECERTRDCCMDRHLACRYFKSSPAVDCVLSDWTDWSTCDARCGPGIKQRTRRILVNPVNGGRPCGPTVEKTACEGTGCKIPRTSDGLGALKETGKIIPAAFGSWRRSKRYDPYKDIRKNLFEHYERHLMQQPRPYCARFRLVTNRPSCRKSPIGEWPKLLVPGATLCVECQPMVLHGRLGGRCAGHGVLHRPTRWTAVTVPGCHGNWVMTTPHSPCQCPADDQLSFVLV